ncbi:MAG TPA: Ig-like domain-containing protein, partial [Candidatus Limnocylindria bacterium]|nr:Ig-like domain-containing protein [Candidatus Limnocylindria bacterium]
ARAAFGPAPAGAPTRALYRGSVARASRRVAEEVELTTRLGPQHVMVKALAHVGTGAGLDGEPVPVAPGVTTCYTVRARKARRDKRIVVVADARGEHALRLGPPRYLCIDPGGQERLCYAARRVRHGAAGPARERVELATAFSSGRLTVRSVVELCLPPASDEPPPPPPPPGPGFFLRISPSSRTVTAGSHPVFEARAYFDVGGSENWSDRVLWRSSDERVAVVHGSAGGAIIDTVGEGTAVLSVVHVPTGVTSTDSNGDATLTVGWPLEKLTISPPAVRKKVGDTEEYTVIGHFTGGTTLNLTQRVTYHSSNSAVARVHVDPARRSLVRTVASGVAVISATDPLTGVSTTDAANDATLRVGGELRFVTIDPDRRYDLVLGVGDVERLTAVGFYADGTTRNITQECVWVSSDPTVFHTPNDEGDRSRVEALSPGWAWVGCRDGTGMEHGYRTISVVTDELVALEVRNGQSPPIRDGHPRSVTALGVFAPFLPHSFFGRRNLTQQVIYYTRDPDIVMASNEEGNRSRLVGVSPGCTEVYAEDPSTGITSPGHHVCNAGRLVGLQVYERGFGSYPYLTVPVGGGIAPRVYGLYESGVWLRLDRLEPDSYVLESSDPSILAVSDDNQFAVGVAPGTASLSARHLTLGVVSSALEVPVKGPIERLRIKPLTITRAIGESEDYSVVALSAPDYEEPVRDGVEYRSSDPSVAVATNVGGRVRTVGAGRATISAVHVPSGARTEADAVIDVVPGVIERVTIEPAEARINPENWLHFTAIGHFGDGRTINVTSQVTWTALQADVALRTGYSRFTGNLPGTTRIVAVHPTGVSSSDSGDDALLRVEPLVDIALSPASRTIRVGDTVRFTVTGRFADGTSINLTQRAYYQIESDSYPAPARADNEEGDRSAVSGLAEGQAILRANVPSAGSRTAALTIVP